MKANPLFVDSTKVQGDVIITVVELENAPTEQGDSVFISFQPNDGAEEIRSLRREPDSQIWKCQLYLQHQNTVRFHFFITRNDELFAKSKIRYLKASYAWQEEWVPEKQSRTTAVAHHTPQIAEANQTNTENIETDEAQLESPTISLDINPYFQTSAFDEALMRFHKRIGRWEAP
jgi:hypothetical protein